MAEKVMVMIKDMKPNGVSDPFGDIDVGGIPVS
jgi:hypothetical protein